MNSLRATPFTGVNIEISGLCNAKCPWCVTGLTPMAKRSQSFMTPDLFQKILERISSEKMIPKGSIISLFNWGEPTLNPHLSTLCEIAMEYGYKIGISTNASVYVELSDKALKNINNVTFSVSGMTQSSYGRIHGFDVNVILNNIRKYCEVFNKAKIKVKLMAFHVYKFNKKEIGKARRFCFANSIIFYPYYAYFNDLDLGMAYLEHKLSPDIQERADKELELSYVKNHIDRRPEIYKCPEFDRLVIDENGQILTCCGVSPGHGDYALGNFLDMSLSEIFKIRHNRPICIKCVNLGLAWWAHNVRLYKNFFGLLWWKITLAPYIPYKNLLKKIFQRTFLSGE